MEGNIYNFTSEELKNMKKIGAGTEGSVYAYKDDLLLKVYHQNANTFTSRSGIIDKNMKIYDKNNKVYNNQYQNHLNYYSYKDEDVKLLPKDAISKAIDRQKDIELTTLPIGALYVDSKFVGCVLKRQKGIQVHKLMGLPLNTRKKIYLNILKANAELVKNNIYHRDLSNSPYVQKQIILPDKTISTTGHSHVLVNPLTLKTNFIDLEGKSTVYTERQNDIFASENISELTILALEFLFKIDYEEYKDEIDSLSYELDDINIPNIYKDKLINQDMSLSDLEDMTLSLKK